MCGCYKGEAGQQQLRAQVGRLGWTGCGSGWFGLCVCAVFVGRKGFALGERDGVDDTTGRDEESQQPRRQWEKAAQGQDHGARQERVRAE